MAIVYDVATLDRYMTHAVDASPGHPILVDRFLEDAFEFDVDAVADATGAVVIGGIMEHIEEAGIHSGDSSCVVPPFLCPERHLATIRDYTRRIARALKVIGLMNVQFATKDDVVYVLEVNPRASRTVPYLSKATGVSLAKVAARVMAGRTLAELGLTRDLEVAGVFVKSPVFPFVRFPGVDTILGPEMKSTGEVMGGASSFGVAFAKAQLSVGQRLPERGTAFVSVNNHDKPNLLPIARDLAELGFQLLASRGTAAYLREHGLLVDVVFKVNEGRPNIADEIVNRKIDLIVNTPLGRESFFDDRALRRAAMLHGVPCITTLTGAAAAVSAIRALRQHGVGVRALQDYYAGIAAGGACTAVHNHGDVLGRRGGMHVDPRSPFATLRRGSPSRRAPRRQADSDTVRLEPGSTPTLKLKTVVAEARLDRDDNLVPRQGSEGIAAGSSERDAVFATRVSSPSRTNTGSPYRTGAS